MKNADYIYAVACIRAKEKTLLTDSDIQTMAGMTGEKEVLSYLVERGWGEGNSTDPEMETVLAQEQEKQMKLLTTLGVDKEIIDILFIEELYHNLKTAIKQVCTGTVDDMAYCETEEYSGSELRRIMRERDFEKLPETLSETASKGMELMLSSRDGQRLDVFVDRACLDAIEKAAATTKDKFLEDYAENKVVIADMKIAVRAADTNKSYAFCEDALSPNRTIDVKALALAASNGRDAVLEYLDKTSFKAGAEALRDSFSAFEKWCDDYIMSTLMNQKTNIMSSGPVVAFYLAKQNEIRTARIIMTAKANGFGEEDIQKRVRRMYG